METPGASAPVTSTPAPAAPAAPASAAPVAAPVSTPSSTPSTPAAGAPASAPVRNQGESNLELLKRVGDQRREELLAERGIKPAETKPEVTPAEPKEPQTAEQTDEPKADETKAEETIEPDADEDDDLSLDEAPKPTQAREFAAELRKPENAELAAALEAKPELKNQIFNALRLASVGSEMKEVFPEGLDYAKESRKSAESFAQLGDLLTQANSAEGARKFINAMTEFSVVLDENGAPLLGPNGQPQTDGTVAAFMDNATSIYLDFMAQQAQQSGNEEIAEAVNILKASLRGPASADEEGNGADQQLKQERDQLLQEKQELATKQHQAFEQSIATKVETEVDGLIESILGKTSVSDFNKPYVTQEIKKGLFEALRANKLFLGQRDQLARRGSSKAVADQRVALAKNTAKRLIAGIAQPIIRKAGGEVVQRQEARREKQNTQTKISSSEPRAAASSVTPQNALSPEALMKQVRTDYFKANGEFPDPRTALTLFNKAQQGR